MALVEDRIARLEADMARLKPSLNERLERLEGAVKQKVPIGRQLLEMLGKYLIPIISSAVILLLGYWIKDSVDHALKRQQLQLSYATEMQVLLEKMSASGAPRSQIEAAALVLTTFGEHAVVPLTNELQLEDSLRAPAAENGLRAMALTESGRACHILEKVLANRTRLYRWETHRRVIRLLGDLHCRDSLPLLKEYQELITEADRDDAGLDKYRLRLRRDSTPGRDSIKQVSIAAERSLELLNRPSTQ